MIQRAGDRLVSCAPALVTNASLVSAVNLMVGKYIQSHSALLLPTPLLWSWIPISARSKLGFIGVVPSHWCRSWRSDENIL